MQTVWRGTRVLGTRVGEMQELDRGRRELARGPQKSVGGEGEGEKWMREIKTERRRMEGNGKKEEGDGGGKGRGVRKRHWLSE